jgi:LacI family transcriptional regulator
MAHQRAIYFSMANTTIHDVAAEAKVSIKTVSRVINNEASVKGPTRERVLKAIRKLDYHPNPSARSLGGSRSYLISLLYDMSCEYYATSVLGGVLEACRAAHYQVVMQPCDYRSSQLADEVTRNIRHSRSDGVILTPPLSDQARLITALDKQRIPYVRIAPAEHTDHRRSVYTNDRESCAQMTEQLVTLGHVRIAFILGNPDHDAIADRFQGFTDGLRGCGVKLDKKLVVQGYNSFVSGVQAARSLLQLPEDKRPTAIFAANDEMAAGVLAVAHQTGLAVPEDISVVGFDDAPLASQVWPALTTIRQPIPAMSAAAAKLLLQQLRDEQPDAQPHVVPSTLAVRQSTGPAPNRQPASRARSRRAQAAETPSEE